MASSSIISSGSIPTPVICRLVENLYISPRSFPKSQRPSQILLRWRWQHRGCHSCRQKTTQLTPSITSTHRGFIYGPRTEKFMFCVESDLCLSLSYRVAAIVWRQDSWGILHPVVCPFGKENRGGLLLNLQTFSRNYEILQFHELKQEKKFASSLKSLLY